MTPILCHGALQACRTSPHDLHSVQNDHVAARTSAGILLYRRANGAVEVFLVHPGGPFWAGKDLGSWSIPKGEYEAGEDPLLAAQREFNEETGFTVDGHFTVLTAVKQPSGKVVSAWGLEGDVKAENLKSNLFVMEWPPKSGRQQTFPEVDRGAWFDLKEARARLVAGQIPLLEELAETLGVSAPAWRRSS